MDFHSTVSHERFDPLAQASHPNDFRSEDQNDFHSEEYLEYRRLVFAELASDYNRRQLRRYHSQISSNSNIPGEHYEFEGILYPLSPGEEYTNFGGFSGDGSIGFMSEVMSPCDDSGPQKVAALHSVQKSPEQSTDSSRLSLSALPEYEVDHFAEKSAGSTTNIDNENCDQIEKQFKSGARQHMDQEKQKVPNLSLCTELSQLGVKQSTRSHLKKEKNERQALLQKLSLEDDDADNSLCRAATLSLDSTVQQDDSRNLQIYCINDSSSSDNDESDINSKASYSGKSFPGSSLECSPHSKTNDSSTSLISSTAPISFASFSYGFLNNGADQERLELHTRLALTQAHREAIRFAEQQRRGNRNECSSSLEKLLQLPLDDVTRMKVRTKSLSKKDCMIMTIGQLQVILNNMCMEKEGLNCELKTILESRDDLRMEQDEKLEQVDKMNAMIAATGPETTV